MRAISDGRKVSNEGDESFAMNVETPPQSATTPQPKATLPTAPIQTKTVMTPTPKLPTTASTKPSPRRLDEAEKNRIYHRVVVEKYSP